MVGLAAALARQGHSVSFIAERELTEQRRQLGWTVPKLDGLTHISNCTRTDFERIARSTPSDAINIVQGIRGNGLVKFAQKILQKRSMRQWVVLETVEDCGWRGVVRRLEYKRILRRKSSSIELILAIGQTTPAWIEQRGVPKGKILPFAYFLDISSAPNTRDVQPGKTFRCLFVGQIIERKRLDLLIDALTDKKLLNVSLTVVGSGPKQTELELYSEKKLGQRVSWLGNKQIAEIPKIIFESDCLVLPSRHDGWGAVVSESLMVGTPVICSDKCGTSGIVLASGVGGVFCTGSVESLISSLTLVTNSTRPDRIDQQKLSDWAACLGSESGALYLVGIANALNHGSQMPLPPWERAQ